MTAGSAFPRQLHVTRVKVILRTVADSQHDNFFFADFKKDSMKITALAVKELTQSHMPFGFRGLRTTLGVFR